jgi:hypothetical protein
MNIKCIIKFPLSLVWGTATAAYSTFPGGTKNVDKGSSEIEFVNGDADYRRVYRDDHVDYHFLFPALIKPALKLP